MARILSISYDATLLQTRELLLEQLGHSVDSAEGFAKAFRVCDDRHGAFDLIVLGHSIPHDDKRAIIKHCMDACPCPVLALTRPNEPLVEGAVRAVDSSNVREFLDAVDSILKESRLSH